MEERRGSGDFRRAPEGGPYSATSPSSGCGPTKHSTPSPELTPLLRRCLGSVEAVVASSTAVATQFLHSHDANFSNCPPSFGTEHVAYNYHDFVFAPLQTPLARPLPPLRTPPLLPVCARRPPPRARARDRTARTPPRGGASAQGGARASARALVGQWVFEDEVAEGNAAKLKEMVVQLMRVAGGFDVGDLVPWLGWLDLQGVVRKMKWLHHCFNAFLDGIIDKHRAAAGNNNSGDKDLLSVLLRLEEQDDGEGGELTDTE